MVDRAAPEPHFSRYRRTAFAWVIMLSGLGHAADPSGTDLADLSLEELVNVEITSVSKRAAPLTDAPASVFLITQDDIRRSGARSLPEALRLAPNLQVARANASTYAISARGFNNSAGNKLLVLIDGRSVYSPLFSGVFWDVQDVMLEDVERIEVISGPGGTLWGTNAVNGVINVITRSAKDTHGGLVMAGTGSHETSGAVRHGGDIGPVGHYRVYAKYFDRDPTSEIDGSARDDAWHKGQVGFRADWGHEGDRFSVHGNAYRGSEGQPAPGTLATGAVYEPGRISLSGANLTARWNHRLEGGSTLMLQAYYDRTERTVPPTFAETLDVVDLQLQHSMRPMGKHTLTWGAGYRYGMDRVTNSEYIAFLPADFNQAWASLFAQDEIVLDENLRLTLGARLERNDYTGNEFLPNARLAWKLAPDHLLWTAASRAVRAPSRLDRDTFIPASPPYLLAGGTGMRSEIATVYEVGYRGRPARRVSYSVTAFHADYDHLRSQEIDSSGTFLFFGNKMEGTTRGLEMWATYQAAQNWRLSGGATLLDADLRRKPGSTDSVGSRAQGNDPGYQWLLRSTLDLTPRHEMDITLRRVGALPNPAISAYTAVDARLGWRINKNVELSMALQNLIGDAHPEFAQLNVQSEYGRSVFLELLWRPSSR